MQTAVRARWFLPVGFAVFTLAFILRIAYPRSIPVPFSADSDYYTMVGENLYRGHGLVASYAWNYLAGIPDKLPTQSNEYWMPGPSFAIAAAFHLAGEVGSRVAQLPSICFDALLCVITFALGLALFRRRAVALLAALLCVISFHLVAIAAYPDPFTMSGVFVNLALLSLWGAARGRPYLGLLAGLSAGLAYLARTDGLLLLGPAAVVAFSLFLRKRRWEAIILASCFSAALGSVLIPWIIRQEHVFANRIDLFRVVFASDFNDLTRVNLTGLTWRAYLSTHPSAQLGYKTYVLLREMLVLGQLAGPMLILAILPLRYRALREQLLSWLSYSVFALLVPAYLVPVIALSGTFSHLATGLLPILVLLGVKAGLDLLSASTAEEGRRRAVWLIFALGIVWFPAWWLSYPKEANRTRQLQYPIVSRTIRKELSPHVALSDMAWGLWNAARIPCAQFPGDGAKAALQVAEAIGADYLITMSDAPNRLPAIREVDRNPQFQFVGRYSGIPADLLVFRILPSEQLSPIMGEKAGSSKH